jgi:PiT family inorganic phosphate transporter
MRQSIKSKVIFREPATNAPPPFWIRLILLLTCTGVSFSHGSNDGQKGVGLVMLILIAIVPAHFTLDLKRNPSEIKGELASMHSILYKIDSTALTADEAFELQKANKYLGDFESKLTNQSSFLDLPHESKFDIRKDLLLMGKAVKKLLESKNVNLSENSKEKLKVSTEKVKSITEYAPDWVILMISLSLGLGTLVGWKRIVTTIGEKIGKQHLTYAQGASAEIVAASTIGFSTWLGLPVSTTHVLSSGIAGSMVASKGIKNLQTKTIKTIALAWLLTLPFSIIMSGLLFLLFRTNL